VICFPCIKAMIGSIPEQMSRKLAKRRLSLVEPTVKIRVIAVAVVFEDTERKLTF